jgi:uncharacterized membrane protein
MFFSRMLMLLALIVWIGGIIFFAFVLAPTVFRVLPTRELAGNVVSPSLHALHWMGIISGLVFLICSLLYSRFKLARLKPFSLSNVLVILMLALTLVSEFSITPRMQALRTEMRTIDNVSANDPRRMEFDRLHGWSEKAEGSVLSLGLAVVLLTSRRFS